MKKYITLALRSDGTTELVHGPEVPFKTQRNTVHQQRETAVPPGVDRVEIWARTVVKFSYKKPAPAKPAGDTSPAPAPAPSAKAKTPTAAK